MLLEKDMPSKMHCLAEVMCGFKDEVPFKKHCDLKLTNQIAKIGVTNWTAMFCSKKHVGRVKLHPAKLQTRCDLFPLPGCK